MKKQLIHELFEKFERACYVYKSIECWSARELQDLFSYSAWRNFIKVIDKAKEACNNVGEMISDHFVDINKMIPLAKGAQREVEDIALTRYALQGSRPEISYPSLRRSCLVLFISGV